MRAPGEMAEDLKRFLDDQPIRGGGLVFSST